MQERTYVRVLLRVLGEGDIQRRPVSLSVRIGKPKLFLTIPKDTWSLGKWMSGAGTPERYRACAIQKTEEWRAQPAQAERLAIVLRQCERRSVDRFGTRLLKIGAGKCLKRSGERGKRMRLDL